MSTETKDFQSIEIKLPSTGRHVHPPEDNRVSIHEIIGTGTVVVQAWETSADWSEHGTRQFFSGPGLCGTRLGKITTRRTGLRGEDARKHQAWIAQMAFERILEHGELIAKKIEAQGFRLVDSERLDGDLWIKIERK